jgi:phosphatidylinositol glycan class F
MRASVTEISAFTAAAAHVLCFAGLAVAHSLAGPGAPVSDPARALRLLVVCEAPVVIAVFSYLRRDPKSCSFFKAAARGLIGLPVAPCWRSEPVVSTTSWLDYQSKCHSLSWVKLLVILSSICFFSSFHFFDLTAHSFFFHARSVL